MKKKIVAVLVLQVIATLLWLWHADYLLENYSVRQYKLGMQDGKRELMTEILGQGGEIPDGVFVYQDKGLAVNLGGGLHQLFVFYPLMGLQSAALLLLISMSMSVFRKKEV